jgi:tetratricopeptide (TPR) repeat protein
MRHPDMTVVRPFLAASLLGGVLFATALAGQQTPAEPTVEAQEQALEALEASGASDRELGILLRELAQLYLGEDRNAEAVAAAQRAVTLLEIDGEPAERARAANRLGVAHWASARYDSAVVNLDRARRIGSELGDPVFLGQVHNNLGAAHYQWGNYELAMEAFLQALELRRAGGDELGEARVLSNVGLTYVDWGRFDAAAEVLEEAIRIAERIGDHPVQGYARLVTGGLHMAMDDWDAAEASYLASLEHFSPQNRLNSMIGLARVELRRGQPERAVEMLSDVLARSGELDQPRTRATTLLALAEAHRAQGDNAMAIARIDEGLGLARQWEQRPLVLQMLSLLSELQEQSGATVAALATLRAQLALRDSIFDQSTGQRIAAMEARAESEHQARENLRLLEEQRVQEVLIRRQRAAGVLGVALLVVSTVLLGVLVYFNRRGRRRETLLADSNDALERTNRELQQALDEVRTLEGLIPICAHCKKVRDDTGYWEAVESYISARSEVLFSHSICAECGPEMYGLDWAPQEAGTADE